MPWRIMLTGKARGWLAAGVVTAVAALIAALWIQTSRLDTAQRKTGELTTRLDAVVEANETNQETINALQEANTKLLERIRADALAAEEAARRAAERHEELRRLKEHARGQLRAALSSSPSCDELARLNLAAACPAFSDRLLGLYQRSSPDGDSDR